MGGSNSESQQEKLERQSPAEERDDDIEHPRYSSSSSATSVSAISRPREDACMARVQTQRDLERNPTVISRIATQRSQHSGTVGAGVQRRPSKKPLANMGNGKPYPPPLPEKEEYVVEFDGPDDPLHPQNWTLKKKYVYRPLLFFILFASTLTTVSLIALSQDSYISHAGVDHPNSIVR